MIKPSQNRLNKAELAAHEMLREAVLGAPKQHLFNWLRCALVDDPRNTGDMLEMFGNQMGFDGHLKSREGL